MEEDNHWWVFNHKDRQFKSLDQKEDVLHSLNKYYLFALEQGNLTPSRSSRAARWPPVEDYSEPVHCWVHFQRINKALKLSRAITGDECKQPWTAHLLGPRRDGGRSSHVMWFRGPTDCACLLWLLLLQQNGARRKSSAGDRKGDCFSFFCLLLESRGQVARLRNVKEKDVLNNVLNVVSAAVKGSTFLQD